MPSRIILPVLWASYSVFLSYSRKLIQEMIVVDYMKCYFRHSEFFNVRSSHFMGKVGYTCKCRDLKSVVFFLMMWAMSGILQVHMASSYGFQCQEKYSLLQCFNFFLVILLCFRFIRDVTMWCFPSRRLDTRPRSNWRDRWQENSNCLLRAGQRFLCCNLEPANTVC